MSKSLGEMIREQVKNSPLTNKEITDQLNRSENTIYNLYTRESIDTNTLTSLCRILNYDFFSHFYEHEPLKSFKLAEQSAVASEIAELRSQVKRKDNIISDLTVSLGLKNEAIQLLQDQLKALKPR